MRYFPSGSDPGSAGIDVIGKTTYPDAMMSYFYSFYKKNSNHMKQAFDFAKTKSIFLDSGGYTARVKGIDLDIDEYVRFFDENGHYFFLAANLDVMDWDKSQDNFRKLRNTKYGDRVVQVYHAHDFLNGRTDEYIQLCKDNEYLGLGGVAGEAWTKELQTKYLNFCFKYAVKYKTKIHGFGMMSTYLVKRYPFYSVDSTSWKQAARWGNVTVFKDNKLVSKSRTGNQITPYAHVHYEKAMIKSLESYAKYCQYITELWKARGITWIN